jgi:outer membrane protein assembly factor BamB
MTRQSVPLSAASLLILAGVFPFIVRAHDWPMWGRTPDRNLSVPGKDPPLEWDTEKKQNIRWVADLGSLSYGGPVVTGGVVYVGTNNEGKRDPAFTADAGVLMAFRECDGEFLWQRASPKLPSGRVNDWPGEGLCSSPYVDVASHRLWYCTNRCEVVCLDVADADRPGYQPKVLWSVDMIKQLGVFPHNMTNCSPVAYRDLLYVITANGVDDTHTKVVAPDAPAIVCLNKDTGAVVWQDNSPGDRILHGQWANPTLVEVNGRTLVLAPLGDSYVYAYEARSGKLVWKFDCNPKDSVYPQGGRNELIAAAAVANGRMYIGTGQNPEHGEGNQADFWCVDLAKAQAIGGDVSTELEAPGGESPRAGQEVVLAADWRKAKGRPNAASAAVWRYHARDADGDGKITSAERMHRTMSTATVAGGLVFVPDFSGFLHCLDAATGTPYWSHDLQGALWASPLVADGKVYIGDENGFVRVFAASKEKQVLAEHDMGGKVYSTPVFANGILYVMTVDKLYSIQQR